jgi:prepilin-type N-terminal cleavage/methylation domain-containing protein
VNRRRPAEGFTLPELLVAITILGIIMGAIGAMITTAFRTSSIVSAQLNASRGPKVVSRYWVPDVESATGIDADAPCGGGPADQAVVTFSWPEDVAPVDQPDQVATDGPLHVVTWWVHQNGARSQLLRSVCAGGSTATPSTLPVVADLSGVPAVEPSDPSTSRRHTIMVTVPERGAKDDQFEFSVGATQQTTGTSPGSVLGP